MAKSTKKAAKKAAKPIAKKAAKPLAKKVVAKAKPIKKASKAPAKAVKKAVPTKNIIAKPAPKKVTKPTPKKKVAAKQVSKKAVKPAPKKIVAQPAAKKVAAKTTSKKAMPVKKPMPVKRNTPVAKDRPNVTSQPTPQAKPAVAPAKPSSVPAKPTTAKVVSHSSHTKTASNAKRPSKGGSSKKVLRDEDGKRIIKSDLPAKALITLNKPEVEEPETNHYEFPTLRYSDAELKEFKEIIDKKLVAAREELANLKDNLESHTESQVGNKSWNMEEGSDTSEMEYLMNQISRLNKFMRDLEMALVRIENKTYGICRATGKLIDKNRLRIVPHATLSIEAKMNRKSDDVTTATGPTAHMGSEGDGFAVEE